MTTLEQTASEIPLADRPLNEATYALVNKINQKYRTQYHHHPIQKYLSIATAIILTSTGLFLGIKENKKYTAPIGLATGILAGYAGLSAYQDTERRRKHEIEVELARLAKNNSNPNTP